MVISPSVRPAPTDFVLAVCDDEPVIRRYRVVSTGGKAPVFSLVASNADYPNYTSDASKITVIGVVIEQRRLRKIG